MNSPPEPPAEPLDSAVSRAKARAGQVPVFKKERVAGRLHEAHAPHGKRASLALAALGIVFGDIGTSPLYTLHECLGEHAGMHQGVLDRAARSADVLGVLSLIVWALTLVVTLKYLTFIMRADNHGEGGIFALLALIPERMKPMEQGRRYVGWVAVAVVAGAALLYGDGMITPAISVLSAIEGLEVATPRLAPLVLPLTCLVLVGLFALQKRGTRDIGILFGPIMVLWFLTIAGLGAYHVLRHPAVLAAINPFYAAHYFAAHGVRGLLVLGAVVLAVTGGEALYADMGHFGASPIRLAWLGMVMPALVLNYFGQGANLLETAGPVENPFFALVPSGVFTYALVALSAVATVIASQALISGAFSLTHQAVQLGFFPRVTVRHTSRDAEGQIYVPQINWGLAIACIALVLTFRESSRLASAYGIAVTGTMVITSVVYFEVTRTTWQWSLWKAVPLLCAFLAFDIPFAVANLFKLIDGGYVPLLVGAVVFTVMITWYRGRRIYLHRLTTQAPPFDTFIDELDSKLAARIPGGAVFLTGAFEGVPAVLLHHVKRIRVLPETVVLLTFDIAHTPYVDDDTMTLEPRGKGLYQLTAQRGFMDQTSVPWTMARAIERFNLDINPSEITYYVGRETFLATSRGEMGQLTEGLFAFLARNARTATAHFQIPPEQVVEIGSQMDL